MVEKLKDGQNANQLQQSSSTFLLEPTDFTHPPIPTNKEAIQKPRQKYDAAMIPRNVMPSDPFLETSKAARHVMLLFPFSRQLGALR